jgi:hypothetical protein
VLLIALTAAAPDGHLGQNPVYKSLREAGVVVADGKSIPLPEPVMPDGLSADEQKKVIQDLGRGKVQYAYNRMIDDSRVAPHILIHPHGEVIGDVRVRTAEAYFVAYGALDLIAGNENKNNPQNDDTDWTNLDAEDLDGRNIELLDPKHEGYGHISRNVLGEVQVDATLRNYWSQTGESIVMANVLDPRFAGDPEFPNVWRSINRTAAGIKKLGDPKPYAGVGCYIKITSLKQPAGALFIEMHMVYAEPNGWFNGANLLGSKMPLIFQTEVRDARGDLEKLKK